jgi:hypothetical protein
MGRKIFTCHGGHIVLPDAALVLVSRQDGGNLIVIPPREVWERSELTPVELMLWSFLAAATGQAMLDVLSQLDGGCINYWDAGNWALNERAEPVGSKTAREYRRVHMHLLGRSRTARDPSWRWGEAPKFPDFADRYGWASKFERLSALECTDVLRRAETLLKTRYGMHSSHIAPRYSCPVCVYPTPAEHGRAQSACEECPGTL